MNGKIKVYKDEKGYGFILGDDGQDYFFHISNVKSANAIKRGDSVTFEKKRNDKGYFANDVKINATSNKFVSLGNIRINKTNIKNYGLSEETVKYIKIYQHKEVDTLASKLNTIFGLNMSNGYEWNGELIEFNDEIDALTFHYSGPISSKGCRLARDNDGKLYCLGADYRLREEDFVDKVHSYLYITTYQGDNFKFFDDKVNFDIMTKLKEIDDIFSS